MPEKKISTIKVHLHSIHFCPFFCFCFCFHTKNYALFRPDFYKPISALDSVTYLILIKILRITMRAVFQNNSVYTLYQKFFSENFCSVCDSLVVAEMDTEPSSEQMKWGGEGSTGRKSGSTKIVKFLLIETHLVRLQIMCNYKNYVFLSKKRPIRPAAFLSSFRLHPIIA